MDSWICNVGAVLWWCLIQRCNVKNTQYNQSLSDPDAMSENKSNAEYCMVAEKSYIARFMQLKAIHESYRLYQWLADIRKRAQVNCDAMHSCRNIQPFLYSGMRFILHTEPTHISFQTSIRKHQYFLCRIY